MARPRSCPSPKSPVISKMKDGYPGKGCRRVKSLSYACFQVYPGNRGGCFRQKYILSRKQNILSGKQSILSRKRINLSRKQKDCGPGQKYP